MFESNEDIDFGDDFGTDLLVIPKKVNNKRPSESPRKETPKKQKIVSLPINAVQRIFPGPAGILPDRKNSNTSLLESPGVKTNQEIPCSQTSLSTFHTSPWTNMSQDYEPLVDLYDIQWIKTNSRLNHLQNRRAPFLAAIIKSIECFDGKYPSVGVLLKDTSGEIQATIHHSLFEKHSEDLVSGAVMVLKQCGVLNYSHKHFLTIMPSNLVRIYRMTNENVVVNNVQEVSCDDLMGKLHCQEKRVSDGGHSSLDETKDDEMWKDALEGVDMNSFFEDF